MHELWLATRGGGFHFRHDGDAWMNTRDGGELFAALSQHVSAQAHAAIALAAPPADTP